MPVICIFTIGISYSQPRWSQEKANGWYKQYDWLVGCNYTPAYAINQLEFWQVETFDTAAINKELSWAHEIGFNMMRVFLHDLLWKSDAKGFKKRINLFLTIAEKHKIKILFVLFDSCWDPVPKPGKQKMPTPFVHNSGWVQSPGKNVLENLEKNKYLKQYVTGILKSFGNDSRILAWDLVNEADNTNNDAYGKIEPINKAALGYKLLSLTFQWAKKVNPSQPLTAAPWSGDWSDTVKMKAFDKLCLYNSDIISFHNYGNAAYFSKSINALQVFHRPVICSEYMARPTGSTFQAILPLCKENKIGACNWGFVDGKTQTKYPWDSWTKQYKHEPALWFHEVLRNDGSPYKQEEVDFIKKITNRF